MSKRKEKYLEYLKSKEWAKTRGDAIICADYKCELCGRKNNLHVHHLSYKRLGFEEPDDLIVLCARCHMKEHGLIKPKKKRKKKKKLTLKQKVRKLKNSQPEKRDPCPSCGQLLFYTKTVIACACGYRKEVIK